MRRSPYSGVPWALLDVASFANIYADSFSSSDLDNDSPQMKALLLAAGEGSRLRPLTNDRPKPMIPLGGRPVLEHLIGLLRQHGVTEVAINLHYKPEVIVEHFGDGRRFGVAVTYSPEARLLGSAGAARQLAWFFDQTFLVLYGDVLTDLDLTGLLEQHQAQRAALTMALYTVPDPTRCGIAALDPSGRITRFVEKPAPDAVFGNLANVGVCVVEPRVLEQIPAGAPADFGHDLIPRLLAQGERLSGQVTNRYVLDIGSPERYEQAQRDVAAGRVQLYPAR